MIHTKSDHQELGRVPQKSSSLEQSAQSKQQRSEGPALSGQLALLSPNLILPAPTERGDGITSQKVAPYTKPSAFEGINNPLTNQKPTVILNT